MNNYTIYMHTNLINGKKYIGQTKQDPKRRWGANGKGYQGNPKFWNAIEKYGWNNFEHKILFTNLSSKEADEIEKNLIQVFDTIQNGYNIKLGGKNFSSEEVANLNLHIGLKERWAIEGRKEQYSQKMKDYYNSLTEDEKYHLYDNRRGSLHPASKKVVCIETGDIFNSLTEAASWAGLSQSGGGNISAQIKGTKKSAGKHPISGVPLHWYFLGFEDAIKEPQLPKKKGTVVKNLETNQVFNTIKEAAEWCGCNSSSICISCKSNGVRGGGRLPEDNKILLHWVYI